MLVHGPDRAGEDGLILGLQGLVMGEVEGCWHLGARLGQQLGKRLEHGTWVGQ